MNILFIFSVLLFYSAWTARSLSNYSNEDPNLSAFTLNCNDISVTLEFDRMIDARTMNISALQIQGVRNLGLSSSDSTFGNYALRVDTFYTSLTNLQSQGNQTFTVQIYFDVNVYAKLVMMQETGKSIKNSFVSLERGFVYSSNGYPSRPILQQAAFRATSYVNDSAPPFITKFGVNMNKAHITFLFSEPIDLYSLRRYGLAAQSRTNTLASGSYSAFSPGNSSYVVVKASDYNRNVTMSIGTDAFNAITANIGLWNDLETTYLSAYYPFVKDVAGNSISTNNIDRVQALVASSYVMDVTPPTLSYWDFDIDVGFLTIVFSKTVRVSYFNISRVVLQSSGNASSANTSSLILSNPKSVSKTLSASVIIYLTATQISFIKLSNGIGRSTNSTYIAIYYGAVIDMSDSQNKYQGIDATVANARKVRSLQVDITRPQLVSASIDMTTQTIALSFSEAISLSSLLTSQISLQSRSVLSPTTEALSPAGLNSNRATLLTKKNGDAILFQMTPVMFNTLKSFNFLGRSKASTFVAITKTFVTDLALVPNLVMPISTGLAMQFTSFVPDTIPPTLSSWYFDMDAGQLHLTFSEPMDLSTIDVTAVSLYSSSKLSPAIKYITLSTSSYVQSLQGFGTIVIIQLASRDLNYIKLHAPLCVTRELCFLTISSDFGTDVGTYENSGQLVINRVIAVNNMACSASFNRDRTSPLLTSAVYDAGLGQLSLFFDEPVIFTDANLITLSDSFGTSFTLSSFSKSDGSRSTNITVNLCSQDLFLLKLSDPIASTASDTFVSLQRGVVVDMFQNPFSGISSWQSACIPDAIVPALTAFYYNNSNAVATLYFNDVIFVSSSYPELMQLVSLSGTTIAMLPSTLVSVTDSNILVVDLSTLKSSIAASGIGDTQSSTLLFFSLSGAAFDVPNSLPTQRISPSNAVRSGNKILSFWLNLQDSYLVLELAAPRPVKLVQATDFNLQSSLASTVVRFTSFNSSSYLTPYFLKLVISDVDLTSIISTLLFSSRFQLSLIVATTGLVDAEGLQLSKAATVPCSYLNTNSITPSLLYFDLDLGTGSLTLYFSNPILVSSLQVSSLYLSSGRSSDAGTLALVDSVIISTGVSQSTVRVSLNAGQYPNDREKIMLRGTSIGSSAATTFLFAGDGFATDNNVPANYLSEIPKFNATSVRRLTPDTVPPQMLYFNLDLTARKLLVFFNEAVNPLSNKPSSYLLLRDPSLPLAEKRFLSTSNTSISESVGRTLVVNISQTDFDAIMYQAPNLCLTASNCFISIRAGAIQDISYNRINILDVFFRFGVKVSTYVPNQRPATLSRYDLSMQEGNMDMYFSDVIQCSSLVLARFTFQSLVFSRGGGSTFTLDNTTSFSCSGRNVRYIHLEFGLQNLIAMKAITALLKSKVFTFLVIAEGGFLDVAGNANAPVNDGSAIQVTNYVGDTVSPLLLSYTVSAQAVLTLYFNEPVNQNSLAIPEISFQDNIPTFVKSYALSAATLTAVDTYKMQLSITLGQDLFRIRIDSVIFDSQMTTYLRCTKFMVYDTSGNALVPVDTANAMIMGPSLKFWDFNMDAKKMYLYFSEAVNSTFAPHGMTLQSSATGTAIPSDSLVLTTAQQVTARDSLSMVFVAPLSNFDVDTIKFTRLANSSSNAYLSIPFGQTLSKSSGTIVPRLKSIEIPTTSARRVRFYYPDVTIPSCLYFDLDLNDGNLLIGFDEPVIAASLVLSSVTILSKEFGNFVTLVSGLTVLNQNLTELQIDISNELFLNTMKLSYREGPLDGLVMQANSVVDFSNNPFPGNFEFSAIAVRRFLPDVTPPSISFSSLDVGRGVMRFVFDEVVDISSCAPFNIFIMSNSTVEHSLYYVQLSNYSLITSSDATQILIDMNIYQFDYFALLDVPQLGKNRNSTFVMIQNVRDLSGNVIVPVGTEVASLVPDDVRPYIISSQIKRHLNKVQFNLFFSESVLLDSFNCSDFVFFAETDSDSAARFQYSDCFNINRITNEIMFYVNDSATSTYSFLSDSTAVIYVAAPAPSLTDISGNLLVPVSTIQGVKIGTSVVKYFVDLMTGTITLILSSPVDASNFDLTQVGFYSTITSSAFNMSANSTVGGLFGDQNRNISICVIRLSADDFINFKMIEPRQSGLYLLIGNYAVKDTIGNWLLTKSKIDLSAPQAFVSDSKRPLITSILLDMSYDKLVISFDEPIRKSSIVLTNFRLQANRTSLGVSVKLTGGTSIVYKNVLTIYFSKEDMVAIKLKAGLARSNSTSYVSCTLNTLSDLFGNFLRAIPFSAAYPVKIYIPDTKDPDLVSYEMDFTRNILTMTFSEPVFSSINLTTITFQSAFLSTDGSKYVVTGGTVLSVNSDVIAVAMLLSDINNIKLIGELGTTRQFTYIVITNGLALDMFGNRNNPIVDGGALAVTTFIRDSIPPKVLAYSFNADKFYILFNMSEPVLMSSVQSAAITISIAVNDKFNYTLSPFSLPVNQQISFNLYLMLSALDMNSIKNLAPLASSRETTWVSFDTTLVQDVFSNPVVAVTPANASKPEKYFPDITPPAIISYSLNMDTMTISLVLSEAISIPRLALNQLTLQTCPVRRFCQSLSLGHSSAKLTIGYPLTTLTIKIPSSEEYYLKFHGIGAETTTGLMSWTDKFAYDSSGNFMLPLWDASVLGFQPRLPDNYQADITQPQLTNWFYDRKNRKVHLRFSEPVMQVNPDQIILYANVKVGQQTTIHSFVFGNATFTMQYNKMNTEILYSFSASCGAGGRTTCDGTNGTDFLLAYKDDPLTLRVAKGAFKDFSVLANFNPSSIAINEGSTVCGKCAEGTFASKNCTVDQDEVCSTCSVCPVGMYMFAPCTLYRDTLCAECSTCRIGTYISSACTATKDTDCSTCTTCTNLEYASQDCANGLDRICSSCESCFIRDPAVRLLCDNDRYKWWAHTNCCNDLNGNQIMCNAVDRQNMLILARNGRHHWVYPDSEPIVVGTQYALGKTWT